MLELIQFYLLGYATLEGLTNGLQRYLQQLSKKKELKSARGNAGRACPKAKLSTSLRSGLPALGTAGPRPAWPTLLRRWRSPRSILAEHNWNKTSSSTNKRISGQPSRPRTSGFPICSFKLANHWALQVQNSFASGVKLLACGKMFRSWRSRNRGVTLGRTEQLVSIVQHYAERVSQLQQFLAANTAEAVPELQFMTKKEWLWLAGEKTPDTPEDYRRAMSLPAFNWRGNGRT